MLILNSVTRLLLSVAPTALLLFGSTGAVVAAYNEQWSSAGIGRPEVNRRAIAGIWKLTPKAATQLPMKEFTVYPKKPKKDEGDDDLPELLLMLKEDGSFQQYTSSLSLENDEDVDIDNSWSEFQSSIKKQQEDDKLRGFIKGTWDFLDGNLILAADRPEERTYSKLADGTASRKQQNDQQTRKHGMPKEADTLLKGRVVAKYQTRLQDNPALSSDSNATATTALDTHLSVPKGSINCGKFFYPKNHPSFFEQPMFPPVVKKGTVTLQQILGSLNTEQEEDKVVEKYQRSDFYNRTFLLTSHPIGHKQQKSNQPGWTNKYRSKEDNADSKTTAEGASSNIRVMEVAFHKNNTFSTTAGLGGAAILRGKFDVVGSEKDQLWMQVIRFGFGRSVSGSVYSEGRMLSHEDAKAYWGTIKTPADEETKDSTAADPTASVSSESDSEGKPKRLEVTGSVLDGWGLEPIPVARFILKEVVNENEVEEEEDEEEEEDFEAKSEDIAKLDPGIESDGIIDWSEEDGGFFQ